MLPAGQMRHRVTFQVLTAGSDDHGQPLRTWSAQASNVAARVTPVRAKEGDQADGLFSVGAIVVVVRYRTDITAAMRVVWRGTNYAISGAPIDVGGRKEGLEMLCILSPGAGD